MSKIRQKYVELFKKLRPSPSKLTMEDMAMPKGYLTIKKVFQDGSEELALDNDPNVIVYASRRHHLAFMYDSNTASDILSTFRVGVGGAVGSDVGGNTNVKVLPANPNATDLYNPIDLGANDTITITPSDPNTEPTDVYLQINFTLSQDEGNGSDISECGLFKASGNIFNHKTFTPIPKTDAFSLVFEWKIRYV